MIDVIVAGAGPAGSIAALALVRAGARVLIVDRDAFPRDKLCGDTLNPGAVALLTELGLTGGPLASALRLRGMRVSGPGAEVLASYPAGQVGLAVRRRIFDAWLLDAAVREGARFESGLVVRGPLLDDAHGLVRGVVLSRPDGRGEWRLPATLTIGADGRRSILAKRLGLRHDPPPRRRWAFGTYAEGVAGMTDIGEMHIRGGWYLGLAPVGGGLTNICVVTPPRPGGRTPLEVIRHAASREPALHARLECATLSNPVRVLGPLAAEVRVPGAPGLLLAGDAAGFVDPMTGDGLHLAMRSALLAAQVASRTLERGDFRHAVEALTAARDARLGPKLHFNHWLRRLVDTPAILRLAAHGARVFPGAIRWAVAYAGDVSR